jgi:D-alanyl-D-alanine carboxypeptidase (penicillin-binding protein 5/6)
MRQRKLWAAVLCAALTVCSASPAALAEEEPSGGLELKSKSAVLMEQTTGEILYEMEPDLPMHPASITKVMTLLLTFEAMEQGKFSLDTVISCSEHACSMGGSQIWLEPGEEMTVHDLLKATAISSANDAAVALAEAVAGSEEGFVELMNRRARELGMDGTTFQNATGLDAEGHLSTARDIAVMSAELLRHPQITEYSTVWMDSLRDGATQLVNTNKLVRFYDGATGLKTGTTDGAGSCLSASATRNGLSLVAVTLGSATSDERFYTARKLLDYGFANYTMAQPPSPEGQLEPVRVLRGVSPSVALEYDTPSAFVVKKGEEGNLTQEITLAQDVEAPVEKGQSLGKVTIALGGRQLGEYRVKAKEAVDRMTFAAGLGKMFCAALAMGS